MQTIKKSSPYKKKPLQNERPPHNNHNGINKNEQFKYQIKPSNIIHINDGKLKHKPYSGVPNSKNQIVNKIINIPRSPKRDILSANPVMMSKIYSKSPPIHQQNSFNAFTRSLQKGRKSPIIHIQIKPVYINNNINIRHSVALPIKNPIKAPNANSKQSIINYSKVSNHSNRSNQSAQSAKNNIPQLKQSCVKEYCYQEEKNLDHRKTMEDFHQIIDNYCNDSSKGYFAIFDGHNGKESAVYCKDNLHMILSKHLHAFNYHFDKSFISSFSKIDEELKASKKANDTGTTATIVLISNEINRQTKTKQKVVYCANVGDSKSYLISKGGKVTKMTTEHKCSDTNEVERIRKSGGIVFSGRVFGTLALTRSIGDLEMKKYGVLNTPSISKNIINENNIFVVLGSDGVWDVITEEDLVNFSKNDINAGDLCKLIIKISIERDSRDNVSCIVIKL